MTQRKSFAEQLVALRLAYATPDHIPEPLETNWTTVAANDNNPEDTAELKHDRKRLVTPSVSEIMRNVREGEVERNDEGQVVRIGRLRFSDGTQTEKTYRFTIDGKLEEYAARMPAGALLGSRDKVDVALGGEENPDEVRNSNVYYADVLGTKPHRHLSGKRYNGVRLRISQVEAKAMLSEAYANTDMTKVTYTRFPDGLPCASAKVAESFLGMQKVTCAGGGSVMWQDIVTAMASRKEFFDAIDALKDGDRAVLEAAKTASNLAEIGGGGHRRTAERRAKRSLIAANDNLMAAIKKVSA